MTVSDQNLCVKKIISGVLYQIYVCMQQTQNKIKLSQKNSKVIQSVLKYETKSSKYTVKLIKPTKVIATCIYKSIQIESES